MKTAIVSKLASLEMRFRKLSDDANTKFNHIVLNIAQRKSWLVKSIHAAMFVYNGETATIVQSYDYVLVEDQCWI